MHIKFRNHLLKWHKGINRDLPWKNYDDAYTIWLSEVLLQQTRVEQARPYFLSFKNNYPTVFDLAKADEQEVMKLWQGLGYYSRARNLHFTAKYIADQNNGKFPDTFDELLKLKGVGKYTAAAIASFAFQKPKAVLDGNVFRVLTRIFNYQDAIDSKEALNYFKQLAEKCLDKKNNAQYNQAIMDFGALQCIPKNPDCDNCIMNKICGAYKNGNVDLIPFKSKKIKKRTRHFNYILFNSEDDKTLLSKRTKKDIWQHLYEFPLYESNNEASLSEIQEFIKDEFENFVSDFEIIGNSNVIQHKLTHQDLYVKFIFVNLKSKISANNLYIVVNFNRLKNYAVPKVIENFINDGGISKIEII